MKGEIDRDFYCSLFKNPLRKCGNLHFNKRCVSGKGNGKACEYYSRKHPTPKQFKKEYGEEWKGAVYFQAGFENDEIGDEWLMGSVDDAYEFFRGDAYTWLFVICACTPWGNPPQDWRPK